MFVFMKVATMVLMCFWEILALKMFKLVTQVSFKIYIFLNFIRIMPLILLGFAPYFV